MLNNFKLIASISFIRRPVDIAAVIFDKVIPRDQGAVRVLVGIKDALFKACVRCEGILDIHHVFTEQMLPHRNTCDFTAFTTFCAIVPTK